MILMAILGGIPAALIFMALTIAIADILIKTLALLTATLILLLMAIAQALYLYLFLCSPVFLWSYVFDSLGPQKTEVLKYSAGKFLEALLLGKLKPLANLIGPEGFFIMMVLFIAQKQNEITLDDLQNYCSQVIPQKI